MKNALQKAILLLLFVTSAVACQSQKKYRIIKTTWAYEKPSGYFFREDNFADALALGEGVIKKNDSDTRFVEESVTLLSAAKSDTVDMNTILANHEPNKNLRQFSMKGYVAELVAYLKEGYKNTNATATSTVKQMKIDGIDFYVIESIISHQEFDKKYGTLMYIAEIDDREFSITATYDTEEDRKLIQRSIAASKFD